MNSLFKPAQDEDFGANVIAFPLHRATHPVADARRYGGSLRQNIEALKGHLRTLEQVVLVLEDPQERQRLKCRIDSQAALLSQRLDQLAAFDRLLQVCCGQ
ncbi:hypothetical protein [Bradyrhizobium sp. DOA9]|uniref:hypothetical protein n=1 Tax=Bradyrhizobium sp. DOA9 TaxID=1126627 RepID=UPI00046A1BD8|nr:hypothetical protein [Bradyrhizobium sp. DOA9]